MNKNQLQHLLRNKYFYTLLLFGVWMIFFDQNKLTNQFRLHSNLSELESRKAYYTEEIEAQTAISQALTNDTVTLEKLAREKYLMKRSNEVIYVIVEE